MRQAKMFCLIFHKYPIKLRKYWYVGNGRYPVPPSGSANNNELKCKKPKLCTNQARQFPRYNENRIVVQPVISRLVIESKLESSKYTAHLRGVHLCLEGQAAIYIQMFSMHQLVHTEKSHESQNQYHCNIW